MNLLLPSAGTGHFINILYIGQKCAVCLHGFYENRRDVMTRWQFIKNRIFLIKQYIPGLKHQQDTQPVSAFILNLPFSVFKGGWYQAVTTSWAWAVLSITVSTIPRSLQTVRTTSTVSRTFGIRQSGFYVNTTELTENLSRYSWKDANSGLTSVNRLNSLKFCGIGVEFRANLRQPLTFWLFVPTNANLLLHFY